jgi:DNA-binding transcriptional ArsR family regulator
MSDLPPDHVIAKALSHPLRARVLAALDGREASPSQIAEEIGVELTLISFHVRHLADAGLITATRTRPVRGAVEHFYRLSVRARIVAEHA